MFVGADLEEAVAAAVAEFGADVDVQAARSVKQGLRGRTHVEVLVAVPSGHAGAATAPRGAAPTPAADGEDPVESTLAALLASADAEEQALQQRARQERAGAVAPYEPQPLAGNPSFAAEFASAFPAALAAAKAEAEAGSGPAEPEPAPRPRVLRAAPPRRERGLDDFTARVRDALQRVPQADDELEDPAEDAEVLEPDTDEIELPREAAAFVPADPVHLVPAAPIRPHPAPALFDEPTLQLPSDGEARPRPASATPPPLPPNERLQDAVRPAPPVEPRPRPRPTPSPGDGAAAASRPPALRAPRSASGSWSRVRLRGLGVPEQVLAALPEPEPAEDLRWLVALTDAIAATVPAPVLDGDADVTATGRGLHGALALLRLGVQGVAPSMLVVDGRAVPATATELALTIRAAIVR